MAANKGETESLFTRQESARWMKRNTDGLREMQAIIFTSMWEDLSDMEAAGDNAPEMVGVIALAAEQNRWRNFSYAAHYAVRGVAVYCMLMAAYLPLYHCRGFKAFRALFEKDTGGSDVFD